MDAEGLRAAQQLSPLRTRRLLCSQCFDAWFWHPRAL